MTLKNGCISGGGETVSFCVAVLDLPCQASCELVALASAHGQVQEAKPSPNSPLLSSYSRSTLLLIQT